MKYQNLFNFRNKLFKETIWSFLAQGVGFIFFIALNIFLARRLGVESFGTWSYFFSIITILLLFSYFGINASSGKYIAQYNKTELLGDVLRSSMKLRVIFSSVFALVVFFIHKSLASILGRPDLEPLFFISIPLFLLAGVTEYLKNVFQGLHRLKFVFMINILEYGLKFFLVWVFFSFSISIISVICSFNFAFLVTVLIGLYLFGTYFYKNNPLSGKKFEKEIFRYSLPLFFISIGFMIATELDTVMIGFLSSDNEVGIYSVAKQIIIKLPHIAVAIAAGVMPIFAKLNFRNKEKLKNIFYRLLKYNGIIFSIIVLIILTLSWSVIPLFFGTEYTKSALVLVLLTPYLILFSFSIFLSSFLDYQGLAKKRAINLIIAIVLNVILNLFLIPIYGGVGAAIATSVSYLPYVILNWVEVRKVLF